MEKVRHWMNQYQVGFISYNEFYSLLDQNNIRGALCEDGGFIGFDYSEQEWIDFK